MALFIASTGTDQGKTYVTRLLCQQLGGAYAIKPVISGYDAEDEQSDTALICHAGGKGLSAEDCSPWRFSAPLSPDYAAQLESESIDFEALTQFCARDEVEIIEGAGGIMSPITKNHTNLDLIEAVNAEALLVSSLYLGCISHILTAVEVLKQRKIVLKGIVLSANSPENMDAELVLASLTPHLAGDLPVFVLNYEENLQVGWKNQPDLTSVSLPK